MTLPLFERDQPELLRTLTQVSHAVSNAASLEEILRLAAEQAVALIGVERSIVLLTDDAGGLRIRAQRGLDHVPSESFAGALDERLISRLAGVLGDPSPEHVLAVPLVVRGCVTGVLAVAPVLAVRASGPREAVLTALADQMAAPLENARLAEEVGHVRRLTEHAERTTGVGIFDLDIATAHVTWSPVIYRLHGLAADMPITVDNWLATIHSDDRPRVEARLAELMYGAPEDLGLTPNDFAELVYRVVLPDGAVRWMVSRMSIILGAVRRPSRVIGVSFDITDRKNVEATLEAGEERFRFACEELAGFVYDWRVDTDHVEFVGAMENLLGMSAADVPDDPRWWESRVHSEDRSRWLKLSMAALESGALGYSVEYRVRHANGHYVDVADAARIVRDTEGRVVRVVGGIRDVSDRKRAETAATRLRHERDELLARLQLQFERMPFACILFDSQRRIIDWNPAAERTFGYTRAEVLGKDGFSVLVPSPLQAVQDIVQRLLAGQMDAQSVNANVTKDGRTITCDWVNTPLRDAQGNVIALMSMAQDITERTRVQAALRASEERFRLATEVLAGFVFDWDVLTNRLEWFGDLAGVLACPAGEVLPDVGWYESRVHPDDLPSAQENVRAAFESGAAAYSNVYRFRHPDGHYIDVADRGRIIRDSTGRAIRVLGGVSDISERRRLERGRDDLLEREQQARVAAEAAIRARDEILGIVSHDLRNPLGAIALCAGALLETNAPSAVEERRILQAIEHAATSTNRLIRDLLDVANIEAGHLAIDAHAEAPGAILAEAAEMFAAAAQQRGLMLETQTEPDLPAIRADAGRVHQALGNLIMNAFKFTDTGGRITLRSEHAPGSVRFAVTDTGVGIAADDLPHVFDRYWQKRRSGGEPGVGLGLAIVRGIVDAHGGHLAVESAPGRGTQFSFTIPTAPAP